MNKWRLLGLVLAVSMTACSTLEGPAHGVYDQNEGFNRGSYKFTDGVDKAVLQPVAKGYDAVMPDVVQQGVTNVFTNISTLPSSVNGFLQGKPGAGVEDLGRFIINSTIGLLGLFDVATKMGLEYHDEDLGQTFAVWGWDRSRFIYMPFLGPTMVRDVPSALFRGYLPRLLLGSDYHWSISVVDTINARANALSLSDIRDTTALDPYVFTRDGYVQRRKYQIYDGEPPVEELFEEFDEFGAEFDDE